MKTVKRNVFRALLPLMALPLLVACPFPWQMENDDSEKEANLALLFLPVPLAINGAWEDQFTIKYDIQASKSIAGGTTGYWKDDYTDAAVVEFSNADREVYTRTGKPSWCTGQGTGMNQCLCYNAGVCYNRTVWTFYNGRFYYCQITSNRPTLEEAKTATPSPYNATNPAANNSCNIFTWSRLDPR
jgi:hypothetical protein